MDHYRLSPAATRQPSVPGDDQSASMPPSVVIGIVAAVLQSMTQSIGDSDGI